MEKSRHLTQKQHDRHVARLARLGCTVVDLDGPTAEEAARTIGLPTTGARGFAITRHRPDRIPLTFHYLISDDESADALLERAVREFNDNEPLPE